MDNPIINSPYNEPMQHWEIGDKGPTGELIEGRRPSESFVPVPKPKKRGKHGTLMFEQPQLDILSVTDELIVENDAIDQLRDEVRHWRDTGYPSVTATSRCLLEHWSSPTRDNRILFAQREAAETAIFLHEVVGRPGYTPSRVGGADWRTLLKDANDTHNAGLPRIALKMATGTGKTVVMTMLIAWQSLNKIANPQDSRFAKRFLVITPGITIRDRLSVLQPASPDNYYDERDILPRHLRGELGKAEISVINYHQLMQRDAKEIKGVAANTRKLLLAGKNMPDDPFKETPQAVVSRVLKGVGGTRGKGEIIVINDEAHHCYQVNTTDRDHADLKSKADADTKADLEDAKVWFRGVDWIRRYSGVKTVYDLSATPFYLKGSGWSEGLIFPWAVSDFSLMDAIESGIVKVPRLPVDDDSAGDVVKYLNLYDQVKDDPAWPKTVRAAPTEPGSWIIPAALDGALRSLYKSYEVSYSRWEEHLQSMGEPPPVMILVTPNTVVSKLIYEWIAGYEKRVGDESVHVTGHLEKFSNVENGSLVAIPRSIIIDSKQLEADDAMSKEFKDAAAEQIEAFKRTLREAGRHSDAENLDDKALLREVMNTVGKKDKLGEQVRCVVSVSMLTEGWDANTVTHILGVRAFGSQLLCEQVIGRGLRRRSYVADDKGMFGVEYANAYGIPFAFIPADKPVPQAKPPEPAIRVEALDERAELEIDFPVLSGYRVEIPDAELIFDVDDAARIRLDNETVPSWVQNEPLIGTPERIEGLKEVREQELAFLVARHILNQFFTTQGDARPWLFPRLVEFTKQWLNQCVDTAPGYTLGYLSLAEPQRLAAEAIYNAITRLESDDARRPRLRPILSPFEPRSSTTGVSFDTRKHHFETTRSHVSHVTLDGKVGNEWERELAVTCEKLAEDGVITSYVKNDHLGFTIPYVYKGRSHQYWPDFLLRLPQQPGEDFTRTLIVEVSGSQKSPGPTKEKARTARDSWCAAVNNHGGFGRWGYVEMGKAAVDDAENYLRKVLRLLIADAPIVGDPDLLYTNLLAGLSREESTEG
ncbi:BPTD_3080 family restriction endonuclease [Rathayibacter soli]|uniref:BPTD_3080 family restriction endonuclease n=1 Tax=Rathayibacter soli TaxID=3144168 RepID=UPI00390825EE